MVRLQLHLRLGLRGALCVHGNVDQLGLCLGNSRMEQSPALSVWIGPLLRCYVSIIETPMLVIETPESYLVRGESPKSSNIPCGPFGDS